jgi:hypothetical protein
MNQYATGNTVEVIGDFTNTSTGAQVDPSQVSVTIRDPNGGENTYTYAASQVVKDSTGIYHYVVLASIVGVWGYRWVGLDTYEAAGEQFFQIMPSQF